MRIARQTALALVLLVVAAPLAAQELESQGDTTRLVDRIDRRDADRSIVTRRGDVALLLVGDDLAIQLTDRGLEEIEVPDEDELEDRSLAGRLLGAMLRAGVRELLDHAVLHPIAYVGSAEYVDGRLVIQDLEGDDLFHITVNDRDVMTDFREREARAFARELRLRIRNDD